MSIYEYPVHTSLSRILILRYCPTGIDLRRAAGWELSDLTIKFPAVSLRYNVLKEIINFSSRRSGPSYMKKISPMYLRHETMWQRYINESSPDKTHCSHPPKYRFA